jgi:hypothetical protein
MQRALEDRQIILLTRELFLARAIQYSEVRRKEVDGFSSPQCTEAVVLNV